MRDWNIRILFLVLGLILGQLAAPIFEVHVLPRVFAASGELSNVPAPAGGWDRDAEVLVETGWLLNGHEYYIVVRTDAGTYFPQIEVADHHDGQQPVQLGRRPNEGGIGDVGSTYEVLLAEVHGDSLRAIENFMQGIDSRDQLAGSGLNLDAPRFGPSFNPIAGPILLTRDRP